MKLSRLRQDEMTGVRTKTEIYDYAKELLENHYDKDIGLSLGLRFTSALQVTYRNGTTSL
jgi:hypothetical protein